MKNIDTKSLGELCIKITDGSHYSPGAVMDGFMMASSKDMDENGWNYSDIKKISKEDFDNLANSDCKPLVNDVLIIKDGNSYLQKVFVVKEEEDIVVLSSIAILRPDCTKVEPEYLKYLLQTSFVKDAASNFVTGAAIPRIILSDFKKVKIPYYPLRTQKRIVSVINKYDKLIEVNCLRIKMLEETARELYKEWFVRMRFPGYKMTKFMKGIPKEWNIKKVKELVERRNFGRIYKADELKNDGKVVVIDQSSKFFLGYHDNAPDHVATANEPMLIFGDHTCKLQLMIEPFSLAENVIPFGSKYGMPIYYLYHLIESLVETTEYKRHWTELITKNVLVGKPEIQERYAQLVKPLYLQIENLIKQNIHLREIRDRLLPRLISGKLTVKDMVPEKAV